MVCALCFATPAYAAESSDYLSWAVFGGAALQVVVALVVGGVNAANARLLRLTDDRVGGMAKRVEQLDNMLRSTREDYLRRAELDERLGRVETELKELRKDNHTELKAIRAENARVLAFLEKVR